MKEFLDFKLLSLDVRRIRSATKRRFLFTRLNERRYDIIFLQETYSIVDVEDIWRTQWRGKLFFAHGSNHSCGVMILVRSDLDFNPRTISCDDEGRSIIIEAEVQGSPFLFVNIYAPNKVQDQSRFFDKLNKNIEDCVLNEELRIILGEDFNVTPPTAKLKFNAHFVNDTLNWKKIYSLPYRVALDTKTREFQYKHSY